jgi:hypothetical protein
MSYHARIRHPPFRVTGRMGAWGKTKRMAGPAGNRSSGTSDSKSWPSAPRPCSQITLASALALGSISTVSRLSALACEDYSDRDRAIGGRPRPDY